MAIPASYTETTIKYYLHDMLGAVATMLGWSPDGADYDEAVDEAIASYGVDDISAITGRDNVRKLRALARREVWRAVMQATTGHYDVTTDGASRNRSQMHVQAREQFDLADAACMSYGEDGYTISSVHISYTDDPYLSPNEGRGE